MLVPDLNKASDPFENKNYFIDTKLTNSLYNLL